MNGSSITVFSNITQYENRLSHYKNRTTGSYMEKFTNSSTKTIKGKKYKYFPIIMEQELIFLKLTI